jgi:hypothetical protein
MLKFPKPHRDANRSGRLYGHGSTAGQPRGRSSRPRCAILATFGCSDLRATSTGRTSPRARHHPRAWCKAPAGVRAVDITPWLRDELTSYRAALGEDVNPRAPIFPTRTGKRRTRHNLLQRVVRPAVLHADEIRKGQGRPTLAQITTHLHLAAVRRRCRASIRYESGRPRGREDHPQHLRAKFCVGAIAARSPPPSTSSSQTPLRRS